MNSVPKITSTRHPPPGGAKPVTNSPNPATALLPSHQRQNRPLKPLINRTFEPIEQFVKTLLECIYEIAMSILHPQSKKMHSPFTPPARINVNPDVLDLSYLHGSFSTKGATQPDRFGLSNMHNTCFANSCLQLLFVSDVFVEKTEEKRKELNDKLLQVSQLLDDLELNPIQDAGHDDVNAVITLCTSNKDKCKAVIDQIRECFTIDDDGHMVIHRNKELAFLQLQNELINDLYHLSGKLLTLSYLACQHEDDDTTASFRNPAFIDNITGSIATVIQDLKLIDFCSAFLELKTLSMEQQILNRNYERKMQQAFWAIPGFFDYLNGDQSQQDDALSRIARAHPITARFLAPLLKSAFSNTATLHLFRGIQESPFTSSYRVGQQYDAQQFLSEILNRLDLVSAFGFGSLKRRDDIKYSLLIPTTPPAALKKTSIIVRFPKDHSDISLDALKKIIEEDLVEKKCLGVIDLPLSYNLDFEECDDDDDACMEYGTSYYDPTIVRQDPKTATRNILLLNTDNEPQKLQDTLKTAIENHPEPYQFTNGAAQEYKDSHGSIERDDVTTAAGQFHRVTTRASYNKQILYLPKDVPIPTETLAIYGLFLNVKKEETYSLSISSISDDKPPTITIYIHPNHPNIPLSVLKNHIRDDLIQNIRLGRIDVPIHCILKFETSAVAPDECINFTVDNSQQVVLERQNKRTLTGILDPVELRIYHGDLPAQGEELDESHFITLVLTPKTFVVQKGVLDSGHYRAFERADDMIALFDDSHTSLHKKDDRTYSDNPTIERSIENKTYITSYTITTKDE
ncbi:MAG: hypothetical protein HY860_04270 [Chlamydiales bacterium]|nr:hypothetical protein [Chlamydiales bacterium]